MSHKVTIMKLDGKPLHRVNINKFSAPIEIFPATTLTADTCYWSMQNTHASTKVGVNRIMLSTSFIGTAASNRSTFKLEKFNTATPAGGTALTPMPFDSAKPASIITEIRFAPAGLTITGLVFSPYFHEINCTSQVNSGVSPEIIMEENDDEQLILNPGEGLAIRAESVLIAGCGLTGSIYWHEFV